MEKKDIKQVLLQIFELQLEYQLRAIRQLQGKPDSEPVKGSPIKGHVKRKNTSPIKKCFIFFSWPQFPHSTVLFCHPSRTRYFVLVGSRFNLCRSAPVTHLEGRWLLVNLYDQIP